MAQGGAASNVTHPINRHARAAKTGSISSVLVITPGGGRTAAGKAGGIYLGRAGSTLAGLRFWQSGLTSFDWV